MNIPTIQRQMPIMEEPSEELYNKEPPKDKGIGEWEAFSLSPDQLLNKLVYEQLLIKMVDDLPSEGQIEVLVNCLRINELRKMAVNVLKMNIEVAKNPQLYPLSLLRSLNTWFSTAEESISGTKELFVELANRWHEETDHLSSPSRITGNDAYLKIISMGNSVVPFILQDLQDRGGDWYLALRILSDNDPVPPEARGDVKQMKECWVRWGRDKGYIR